MKKLIMFSAVFTFLVNILIAQNDFSHMSKRLSQEKVNLLLMLLII